MVTSVVDERETRGINNPFVVEVRSRIDEEVGDVVPIPTCAFETEMQKVSRRLANTNFLIDNMCVWEMRVWVHFLACLTDIL